MQGVSTGNEDYSPASCSAFISAKALLPCLPQPAKKSVCSPAPEKREHPIQSGRIRAADSATDKSAKLNQVKY